MLCSVLPLCYFNTFYFVARQWVRREGNGDISNPNTAQCAMEVMIRLPAPELDREGAGRGRQPWDPPMQGDGQKSL